MLAEYFAGTRSSLIIIPKKNGKTTVLGALGLFHLLSTPDAECVIAAASREQAGIMLRQIRGFIRRSPRLRERLKITQRVISYPKLDGQIRILASDVDTMDGVIPSLALIDELHRHKRADVYGVLRDGLGPRNGKLITISTAGDDENSPLGQLRTAAYALKGVKRKGAYRHVTTDDFALHEWALEPDQDRDDLKLVKAANPASWQTKEELRRRHDDPSMTPWQWARFACGVWMAGENAAISEKEWRACADPAAVIPEEVPGVFIGIDIGWKHDYTALVPIWRPDDEEVVRVGDPVVLKPPGDGTSLDVEDIFAEVEQMAAKWPELTIVMDPEVGGEQLAQRIDRELDVTVATHSQKTGPMILAAHRISEAISAGRITHPDDDELNRHVLAASPRSVGEGWRFAKPKGKDMKIDALIALAMAHSVLVAEPEKRSKTVKFF